MGIRSAIFASSLFLATAAHAEYRTENVAGWELTANTDEGNPEDPPSPYSYEMTHRGSKLMVEYEIKAGQQRELGVQRLNCGDATDASGGVFYSEAFYLTGDAARDAAGLRELAATLDASFDTSCKADPTALAAAMKDFGTAAARLESWAAAKPIAPVWAWFLDYSYDPQGHSIARQNQAFSVRYVVPFDPAVEGGLAVEPVDCPSVEGFLEPYNVPVARGGSPADHYRRVRAAIDAGIAKVAAQCGTSPAAGARLTDGLAEAIALAEEAARKERAAE